MLNVDFAHGEIVDIRRRECRTDTCSRSGNQTVSLVQGDAPHRIRPAPTARPHPLGRSQRREAQAIEQPSCRQLLAGAQPTPNLLDRDRTSPRLRADASESDNTSRSRPTAKRIDEYGRIQQQASHHQPERRRSPCLCRRTHIAGSSSHSCPESDTLPSADSMSSQRRSSSRPRLINSATKALRRRAPARWSSSATNSSSNAMCMRMG